MPPREQRPQAANPESAAHQSNHDTPDIATTSANHNAGPYSASTRRRPCNAVPPPKHLLVNTEPDWVREKLRWLGGLIAAIDADTNDFIQSWDGDTRGIASRYLPSRRGPPLERDRQLLAPWMDENGDAFGGDEDGDTLLDAVCPEIKRAAPVERTEPTGALKLWRDELRAGKRKATTCDVLRRAAGYEQAGLENRRQGLALAAQDQFDAADRVLIEAAERKAKR